MLSLLEARLGSGLRLLQVREPGLPPEKQDAFTRQAIDLAHRYGCKVLTKAHFPARTGCITPQRSSRN